MTTHDVSTGGSDLAGMSASAIAEAVTGGKATSRSVVEATLARISALDPKVNAFTDVTATRALRAADAIDRQRAAGAKLGPLAGVPFAVKNLFDIKGLPTRAGSKINRAYPPAVRDATLIESLERQGAILVGALNMGEYAFDFTGENIHDGPSRNPHDLRRMSGGSSGGSGSAIAAGLVPLALGSDTNGSIRVPSSLCGVFGLKPTYSRLSRSRTFPFVSAFDHLGPFARNVRDLAIAYDAMQGLDADDPVQARRGSDPVAATLEQDTGQLRVAIAGGYFRNKGGADAHAAVDRVAHALGAQGAVDFPDVERARAAATVITAAEGAALHARRLRERAGDFDPAVRNRMIGGLATPASWVDAAQRFRFRFLQQTLKIFEDVDIIIAPSTPCRAPLIGQTTFELNGETVLVRPNLGLFTQPISFIGLPVVAVPVWLDDGLPIGVQVIAAPWREDLALRVARRLEDSGAVSAPIAKGLS